MAELDYDALQRLADAATPGPWAWEGDLSENEASLAPDRKSGGPGFVLSAYGLHTEGFVDVGVADAEFIAAARTAIPVLLDRVRETHKAWERAWRINESLTKERNAALSAIAKVRALHYEHEGPHCYTVCAHRYCIDDAGDQHRWPCPTIRALGSVPSTGEGNE